MSIIPAVQVRGPVTHGAAARNWVEISRSALRQNLAYVRRQLPASTDVCAVVKADAYGHGADACAHVFCQDRVRWLAVTSAEEGARLRAAGLARPRILVLAGFAEEEAPMLIENRLTPAVWDPQQIEWLSSALDGGGELPRFAVHLKVETGMGRLGVTEAQEPAMLAALDRSPRLRVEAVFSHLAASESEDESGSRRQQALFVAARQRLGFSSDAHLLNSEGALRYPSWGETMVRTGMALYGYSVHARHREHLRPALCWKTHVVSVKEIPAGQGVGYDSDFRAPGPMRIATLAVGYADGFRRQIWPRGHVLVAGHPAAVIGNISMDLTTVDVTAIPRSEVRLGDEVVLLGESGAQKITARDLAEWAGTIPYEILCGLSARVQRRYLD